MSIDVIKLVREIADKDKVDPFINGFFILTPDELDRFAARHRALALEEAARTCDELAELSRTSETDSMWQHGECAAAIRALKPQE